MEILIGGAFFIGVLALARQLDLKKSLKLAAAVVLAAVVWPLRSNEGASPLYGEENRREHAQEEREEHDRQHREGETHHHPPGEEHEPLPSQPLDSHLTKTFLDSQIPMVAQDTIDARTQSPGVVAPTDHMNLGNIAIGQFTSVVLASGTADVFGPNVLVVRLTDPFVVVGEDGAISLNLEAIRDNPAVVTEAIAAAASENSLVIPVAYSAPSFGRSPSSLWTGGDQLTGLVFKPNADRPVGTRLNNQDRFGGRGQA